ncbi:MAG: UDP-N-acetylglucosamine 2-epimerase (non-hydrolyzing) [Ignavibacteria bacterium]|nr:UDP-N-acetylglucosamine 2-epimerase (non-hydrolyzing) [Ignavibacteria bacterium]
MKTILIIFGTRPEGIKLAPLINKLRESNDFKVITCLTSQHREMLVQVVNFFNLKIDIDLKIMTKNQSLDYITKQIIFKLEKVFDSISPDLTIVQGDATTSFSGALSSFYHKVPVAHIEAGLRTHDKYFPYPEEINRCLITRIAEYHFAPTKKAFENLKQESIPEENIFLVGNTAIDSQLFVVDIVNKNENKYFRNFKEIDFSKKIILVTCHRRENFGKPFESICEALVQISENFNDIEIVFPVHLNPNIREYAFSKLKSPKIHLFNPLDYPSLLFIMKHSYFILSDSGGIQEEAPTFGKPVLVLRNKTERIESVELGISKIVGTDKTKIIEWAEKLLTDEKIYKDMAKICFPYGNGTTSEKIFKILKSILI